MAGHDGEERNSWWPLVATALAAVLCCGGPALAVLLASAGLGVLVVRIAPYAAIAGVVAAIVVIRRRRTRADPGAIESCCGPVTLRRADGGDARPRERGLPAGSGGPAAKVEEQRAASRVR
jgi:hypothetical protein